jgi:hypothetical protein
MDAAGEHAYHPERKWLIVTSKVHQEDAAEGCSEDLGEMDQITGICIYFNDRRLLIA